MPQTESRARAAKAARKALPVEVTSIPHSWGVPYWPSNVYPNDAKRASALIRRNKAELIRLGALARIDRRLTVLGSGWAMFLASKIGNVAGWQCPANKAKQQQSAA
jgi:hypothetical protein